MEFKKCSRCGDFYVTSTAICGNCLNTESLEILKLKDYLESNDYKVPSIENLSFKTGITVKNLNRQLQENDFKIVE